MIATPYPDQLRSELEIVRKDANLPRNYEFKFHSLTPTRLRQEVFTTLRQMDFSIWAVIADKTFLPTSFQKMSRTDFYLYFIAELLSTIPAPGLEKSVLILDWDLAAHAPRSNASWAERQRDRKDSLFGRIVVTTISQKQK